jgi:hypothetical protein
MLPLYQTYLSPHLTRAELLLLSILIQMLQIHKWVRLESLANRLPIPITFESRRKKLQRFLSLKVLDVEKLWFPILSEILKCYYSSDKPLYLVIDRTRWQNLNILMVSVIYYQRAIPVYFELLEKKGNSSVCKQIEVLKKIFPVFKNYQAVLLGDREFCGVDLAKWLTETGSMKFVLRVKKNEYFAENGDWKDLSSLGLQPGMSIYYEGVKITKSKGFKPINIAAKWKKNYRNKKSKEPWFLMTNLSGLSAAILAYQKRMGIEEMFRDFKKGGYNLEATQLEGKRLLSLLIIITLAYTEAILWGDSLQSKGVSHYVGRPQEAQRSTRRHSRFYLGLHGRDWVDSIKIFSEEVQELLSLSPQKRPDYQRGRRAETLIGHCF